MTFIPDDANKLLSRRDTAAALTEAGYPTSPATLATMASRGGGPPFQKFGPRALYQWGTSLEWGRERLGPVVRTTAELDEMRQRRGADDRPAA